MSRDETKDREILAEMYERHAHAVFARCRYLLRDEEGAQDAMHDVFIKAQRNLASFRGDASPLTWLTRIATNHCLNIIRAKSAAWHDKFRREVVTASQEGLQDDVMGHGERSQLLNLCLNKCERSVAEVAIYYFVDEMTQAEITALAGISAPTLRKRLREFIQLSRDEIAAAVPGVRFNAPPI